MTNTEKLQWEVDGKDGSSILIVEKDGDPDMSVAPFIRVYGPNKERVAADVVRACNAYDDLLDLLRDISGALHSFDPMKERIIATIRKATEGA